MSRSSRPYADGAEFARTFTGLDAETPVAGFYRIRLGAGTVALAIKIWFGPPHDPVTGEEMDRSWRWQVQADDGELLELDRVWPACARSPITEADFHARQGRRRWAQSSAPDSAYADRRKRYDPLSTATPLPF